MTSRCLPILGSAALVLAATEGSARACVQCLELTHTGTLPAEVVTGFVGAPALPPSSATSLGILLNADSGLAGNLAALAAFERGVAQWTSRISSPVTLTIDAGLGSLGSNIIGSTSSVILQGSYGLIRDRLVASAAADSDDGLVSSLPTADEFTATLPAGLTLSGDIIATKANLKAMGFAGLDDFFGASDATITFSSDFAFDYDNRDGVDAGTIDFETVVTHEIGHVLGFITIVDSINAGATDVAVTPWDLFRFPAAASTADLATPAGFRNTPRLLTPGIAAITPDLLGGGWSLSTGLATAFPGTDGRQASHWKDADLTGQFIGVMDPTLASGTALVITDADLRLLDLIGWEILTPVPEPAIAVAAFSGGIVVVALGRRRRSRTI